MAAAKISLTYTTGILLLAVGYMLLAPMSNGLGETAVWEKWRELFYFLAGVQLLGTLLAAPAITVTSIPFITRDKLKTEPKEISGERSGFLLELSAALRFTGIPVICTLPIYVFVMIAGRLSPFLVSAVYLYQGSVLFLLVFFAVVVMSSLKRKGRSLLLLYGAVMTVFAGTGLGAIGLGSVLYPHGGWAPFFLLGLNPMAALLSILNADFSGQVFGGDPSLQLWHVFAGFYSVSVCVLIRSCTRLFPR